MGQKIEGESKYAALGVDAGKANIRKAFGHYVENEFPDAFVNIVGDPTKEDG